MQQKHKDELKRFVEFKPAVGSLTKVCLSGSHLYGTANEHSDLDIRGIFSLPIKCFLSLSEPKLEIEPEGYEDAKLFEVKKFIALLAKGNPHQIEILFAEPIKQSQEYIHIVDSNKTKFLCKNNIEAAYRGFATSEFRKGMGKGELVKYRHLKHSYRLLIQGSELLETGKLTPKLSGNILETYENIINGHYSDLELEDMFETLSLNLNNSYKRSNLPETPDYVFLDKALMGMRNI